MPVPSRELLFRDALSREPADRSFAPQRGPRARNLPRRSLHLGAARTTYKEVVVGGLKTACLSRVELTQLMVEHCFAKRATRALPPKLVIAVNGHSLSLAAKDPEFHAYHELADIIHADGQPIVFASKFLTSAPIPERSATTDLFHDAARAAARHGLKFYLLGAKEEVNAQCADRMRELYPGLKIVGRHHGYFSYDEEAEICEDINRSGADVVWVGLGIPLEHAFCVRNKHRLAVGWIVTAGGCYNYVTGHYRRAPDWMQATGLEWLYRVWREPRRLFWRYAVTNPHALFLLLTRTGRAASRHSAEELGPKVAEFGA
jgi:exopolysaccharide biosynthesis WecB/TagA/CpsF family protein